LEGGRVTERVRDSVAANAYDLPWLERASELLAEPDPGPTPWLVEDLLVAGCVGAVGGAPKTGKTWAILELVLAVVTGRPAFGRFAVPATGPVILVLEESGRAALHRRLGALCRGNAIRPEDLADLHFSANRRVRLDDLEWQTQLSNAVGTLEPVAVFLDPLARMKAPKRDENAQGEMAVLLDFMRYLRDLREPHPAVVFCHHEGHAGGHLRGSSDLESYWESKVTLKRTEDEHELSAEHREEEASGAYKFRQAWDHETRSVRLKLFESELDEQVSAYLEKHPDASANDVAKAVEGKRVDVLAAVKRVREKGGSRFGNHREPPPSGSLAGGSQKEAPLRSRGPSRNHQGASGSHDQEPSSLFTGEERRIAKERIDKARRAQLEREDAERRERDAELEWDE
jgi:RecA-family ATPase